MRISIANRITISFGWETMLTLLVCLVWAVVLVGYSRGVVNRLPFFGDHPDETLAAFIAIPALLALPALVNKFCLADYLFFFACTAYYLWCYLAFPENTPYLDERAFECLCCVYPYYFIGRVTDIDKLFNAFLGLSTVCILIDLFYFLVYMPSQKNMAGMDLYDNMYRAYQSLPHVAMLLWATLEKFRIWKAVMLFLGTMFLLSCGTRGPLVCLGFFGTVYFFFYMNFKGAIYAKGIILTIIVMVLAFLKEIVLFLAQTFFNLNLSTRILEKIVSGDLGNDTFRSVLRDKLYFVLENGDHFWGLGAFGCQNYGVIYPHFLPLDFFCTFGYFTGTVLLLLLTMLIVYALWVCRGKRSQVFIVFLSSISIVKLMFTGTFLNEVFLFFLIGFCVKEILSYQQLVRQA